MPAATYGRPGDIMIFEAAGAMTGACMMRLAKICQVTRAAPDPSLYRHDGRTARGQAMQDERLSAAISLDRMSYCRRYDKRSLFETGTSLKLYQLYYMLTFRAGFRQPSAMLFAG